MGSYKKEERKWQSKAKLRLSQKIGTLAEICSDSSALLKSTPDKAFGSRQSFGKAMKRMKSSLPKSPEKKKAVVNALASEVGSTCSPITKPQTSLCLLQNHTRH